MRGPIRRLLELFGVGNSRFDVAEIRYSLALKDFTPVGRNSRIVSTGLCVNQVHSGLANKPRIHPGNAADRLKPLPVFNEP